MSDRPILFSAPMIAVLLAGRKSQTRRILKAEGQMKGADLTVCPSARISGDWIAFDHPMGGPFTCVQKRFSIGDRLWVREAHAFVGSVDPGWLLYRANGYEAECKRHGFDRPYPSEDLVRWRPSIHLPRWASRLTLAVTDVRIERLQSISEADAIAEGIGPSIGGMWSGAEGQAGTTPRAAYALLWNTINGPGAWEANPWCAVIGFSVERANIDASRQPEPVSAGKAAL